MTGLTYSWDFGDGQTLSTQSKTFSHAYAQAGTYNVSLTVTDAYGAGDSIQNLIIVQNENMSEVAFCNFGPGPRATTLTFSIDGVTSFSLDHTYTSDIYQNPSDCECKIISLQANQSYDIEITSTDLLTYPNSAYGGYPVLPFIGSISINSSTEIFSTRYNFDGTPENPYGTFSVVRGGANYCRSSIYK